MTEVQQPRSVPNAPVYKSVSTDGSNDGTAVVELALFAPYNERVELLAEWLDWKPLPMTRGDDGWWRAQAQLADGSYRYRYRVQSNSWFVKGEMVEVPDPYGLETTHGTPEDTLLRIKDGKRQWVDYAWQHDSRPLPPNDQLVIYEMHVGDFAGTKDRPGTFKDAIAKLDYIQQLGFNTIELMPVKEFPGRGWGYSLKSLFGVENTYGTPEDLCSFVDECHLRQIRVIIDGVYNHAHADAYLAQMDYEYWFYRVNPDGPEMDWGPKYNYEYFDEKLKLHPARKYVIDSIKFWIEKFHIDGVRFDATAAIKNFDILRELSGAAYAMVENIKPFICVAEHIPEDPAVTGRERGAPMDAAWHNALGMQLQAILGGAAIYDFKPDGVERLTQLLNPATNGYETDERTITFVGNHDFSRPMEIIGAEGGMFGEDAFRRMKLGHAIILTAPGIPMIWMGTEFGMPGKKTLDPLPLDWSLLENADNKDLLDFHEKLVQLRRTTPALHGGDMKYLFIDQQRQLFAFRRSRSVVDIESGGCVFVAVNMKDEAAGEITLHDECLSPGDWWDVLSGWDVKVTEPGKLTLSLDRSEVKVLVRR